MEPQPFCALPWCGASFGGPNKRYRVDGQILEYPEGIDFHHVDGHHRGPGVFICHPCHMEHTHVRAVSIVWDERWTARRPWLHEDYTPLRIADPEEAA
jgi:hypothetical protein